MVGPGWLRKERGFPKILTELVILCAARHAGDASADTGIVTGSASMMTQAGPSDMISRSGHGAAPMERRAWVYILANRPRGVLYTGVTSNLAARVSQHRLAQDGGFTSRYGVSNLVWCAEFLSINEAIAHEKRIKKWRRAWKIELIEKDNPNWDDLFAKEFN